MSVFKTTYSTKELKYNLPELLPQTSADTPRPISPRGHKHPKGINTRELVVVAQL